MIAFSWCSPHDVKFKQGVEIAKLADCIIKEFCSLGS